MILTCGNVFHIKKKKYFNRYRPLFFAISNAVLIIKKINTNLALCLQAQDKEAFSFPTANLLLHLLHVKKGQKQGDCWVVWTLVFLSSRSQIEWAKNNLFLIKFVLSGPTQSMGRLETNF